MRNKKNYLKYILLSIAILIFIAIAIIIYSYKLKENLTTQANLYDIYKNIMKMTYILSSFIILVLIVPLYSIILSNNKKNTKVYNLTYIDKITEGYSYNKFSEEFMKNNDSVSKKALMLLDIDNFKLLNALFGHEEGNLILKEIYNIIVQECATKGFCCRKESDHYLIFYKYSKDKELQEFVERVYNKIASYTILDSDYVLTTSIGICLFTEETESIEDLENKAITAWKSVKIDNYKYYNFFDDKVLEEMVKNKKLLDKLIKATNKNKLEIYYQPKYDAKNKNIVGAEALLRWKNGANFISPGKFIPIAEEFGYIKVIDEYVIKAVCRDLARLKNQNIKIVPVSVNVSRKKMEEKNFVEDYLNIIKSSGLELSDVQLEITEGTMLSDEKTIKDAVEKMKEVGLYTLIDDFGTGYSSISSLKDLKIDGIKIDRSFIIDESEKGIEILKYVINLAKVLNAKTTAEGVETEEQYNRVRDLGCDIIQGFYFSKAITFDEFSEKLK